MPRGDASERAPTRRAARRRAGRRGHGRPRSRHAHSAAAGLRDAGAATVVDPVESAEAGGLRYVRDDGRAGIRRIRSGRGFRYADPHGRALRDPATLRRIRALAVPPAWTDVWICPLANGHLQATGRDARRRKQYRYHPPGASFATRRSSPA